MDAERLVYTRLLASIGHRSRKTSPISKNSQRVVRGEKQMEMAEQNALKQLEEIQKLIDEHQSKQNYHRGFGSPSENVKAILREYEDKTTRAYSDVRQVRDDMVTYFRALALVLTMTGEAQTHAEKNARLRGAIE